MWSLNIPNLKWRGWSNASGHILSLLRNLYKLKRLTPIHVEGQQVVDGLRTNWDMLIPSPNHHHGDHGTPCWAPKKRMFWIGGVISKAWLGLSLLSISWAFPNSIMYVPRSDQIVATPMVSIMDTALWGNKRLITVIERCETPHSLWSPSLLRRLSWWWCSLNPVCT